MNLQAAHPTKNEERNPATRGRVSTLPPKSPFMRSSRALPRIGGSTMRNENCAISSFRFPSSRPVAIVVPERDSPGMVAAACAKPMMKASRYDISCLLRGLA